MSTPREEEPQIRVPMIDVAVGMPGATPKEVERRLVEPLERAIWEVADVEYVYSVAQPDGAMVTARFKVGTEPEMALTRLYGKLMANMDQMPAGATPPFVTLHGINEVPILTLTLSGGSDAGDGYLLRQQAVELAAELKRIPDVAESWVIGGAPREVSVTLDPQALAARGLSGGAVFQALGAANAELPAGELVSGNRTVPVRVGHLLRNVDDVGEVVVAVMNDRAIRLRDVATIEDGPAQPDQYVAFLPGGGRGEDFEPAVTIALAKREGKNAATIAHAALHRVEELKGKVVGDDVRMTVTRDYGETATEKSGELLFHILVATLRCGGAGMARPGLAGGRGGAGGRSGHLGSDPLGLPALRIHPEPDHPLRPGLRHRNPGGRRHRGGGEHRPAPGAEAAASRRGGRPGRGRGGESHDPRHLHGHRGHSAHGLRIGAHGTLHGAHPGGGLGGHALLAWPWPSSSRPTWPFGW